MSGMQPEPTNGTNPLPVAAVELNKSVLPTAPSESTALIAIEPIAATELVSTKGSMRNLLKQAKNGEQYLAEATELATRIDLGNLQVILEHGKEARDALASVANEMIGDRRLGNAGPIGELFGSLADLEKELNVGELTQPKSTLTNFLTNLPWGLGTRFEPVVRFVERFKKIKSDIDSKEETLKQLEAGRIESKHELGALKETVIQGFRSLEVSIAAGEIVMEREIGRFVADREKLAGSGDVVQLQELKDRRLAIVNLDNRLMRLQTARGDALMDLPTIDLAIDNEEKLRGTLEDLRTITIPQIRKAVAIALRIYDQREAVTLAGGIQDLNEALRDANLTALGMAQEETHQVAIRAAKEVEHLVKSMEKLSDLVTRGTELLRENSELNNSARTKLGEAESRFKASLRDALEDQAS